MAENKEKKTVDEAVDENSVSEDTVKAENSDVNESTGAQNTSEDINTDEATTDSENNADEENTSQTDDEGSDKEAGKDIKKAKKPRKKDKRDEEIAELKDRVTRNLAEFDNFRKRTEREKSQMFDLGAKSMIEKILPVIDNFERGLATLDEKGLEDPFAAGIQKTYKQLVTTLTDAGVTAIEAVGNEFNPDLHNAVMHVDDESLGENVVCEEFQKGYMYKDTVVRHSMVKVAN